MADMMFVFMVAGESVIRILERGSGFDFDIFWVGFWRDITLLAGAALG